MKTTYNLFIFRRDLRTVDNTALHKLYQTYPDIPILPIFIFDPQQIDPAKNPYYSTPAVEFMLESLSAVDAPMHFFHGSNTHVLESILKSIPINAIAFNTDFTPFAQQRDAQIEEWCASKNIHLITAPDYTLFDFKIKNQNDKFYEVFTPYYKKCLANFKLIPRPLNPQKYPFVHKKLPNALTKIAQFLPAVPTPHRALYGGREPALHILHQIVHGAFKNYDKERDFPAMDKTTHLSSYLKFGCVSIREVFWACAKAYGHHHGLPRELIWREFFANLFTLPQKPIAKTWPPLDLQKLKQWQQGKTGVPLIDAAMICLNQTGYMHNRLRMITAMYLTHDLKIHWSHGEQYFAQKLVDYDPASNTGNWRAIASENYRFFNPDTQAKKFDKNGEFIQRWKKIS